MSRYAGRFPTNRAQADKMIGTRQNMAIPKVGNTRMERQRDGSLEIRHHGNTIMTFHADGTRSYTTSGYSSQSTVDRLNAMTPPGVHFRIKDGSAIFEIPRKMFSYRYSAAAYELFVGVDGEATGREIQR